MSPVFECRDSAQLLTGMRQARQAIGRDQLIVMPTDTVYGVAADAFSPRAVQRLLDAKGRGRQQPPPVLVGNHAAMAALVESVPETVERLVERFWPGGLTIVLPAQPSLSWDLGETMGTVAVRMPDHSIARELLEETGPLAVSSANLTGRPAAVAIDAAVDMLGDSVAVYLDDGPSRSGVASTIIDATSLLTDDEPRVRVLRDGAVTRDELREVLGDLLDDVDDEDHDGAGQEATGTAEGHSAEPPGEAPAEDGADGPGDAADDPRDAFARALEASADRAAAEDPGGGQRGAETGAADRPPGTPA